MILLVLAIFLALPAHLVFSAKSCESGWTTFEGKCYKIWPDEVTFEEAKKRCEKEGANLVTVGSEAENKFMGKMIDDSNTGASIWLGINIVRDKSAAGNIISAKWHDDTPMTFGDPTKGTDAKNKPWTDASKGHEKGNCIWTYFGPTWMLRKCDDKNNFICKKKPGDGEESGYGGKEKEKYGKEKEESGYGGKEKKCPSDWTTFEEKCYKIWPDEVVFEEAKKRCEKEGANLVTIGSEAENKFMWKEVEKSNTGASIWLGMDIARDKSAAANIVSAKWQDDTPMTFGDPTKGTDAKNKPWTDASKGHEKGNCIWTYFGPTWMLRKCDDKNNFMCKKKPGA